MRKTILIIGTLFLLLPTLLAQEDLYDVKKHSGISKGQDEVAAVLYAPRDSFLVYASKKTNVGLSSPETNYGDKLFTVLKFKLKGEKDSKTTGEQDSDVERNAAFDPILNTRKQEGPVSFTGDYKTIVFSQQWTTRENRLSDPDPMGIFFGENVDGQWINIKPFEHNDPNGWLFSPSISADGRTLYFSANFTDSKGGFDLYMSELKGDAWTKPENLGPGVNTPLEELYPFIHPSGRLYFSSSGHGSRRAVFNLYETNLVNGKWIEAEKLSEDFNSKNNEYHVWFSEDMRTGYMSRSRGSGPRSIFEIKTNLPPLDNPVPIKKTFFKYRIYDRKLDTVDTNLFTYSWTINDTLELPGHEVIYRFPKPGTYICKMNVFDIQLDTLIDGQSGLTLNIILKEQAVITCPDTIQVGIPVDFDASQTHLPEFDKENEPIYNWEFGDGKFGRGILVSHTYNHPGKFKVILAVEEEKQNRSHVPKVSPPVFKEVVVISD